MNAKYFFLIIVVFCNSLIIAQFTNLTLPNKNNSFRYFDNISQPIILSKTKLDFIQLDSLRTYSLDGSSLKHVFHYSENGKLTEWIWDNMLKDEYFYNNDNYIERVINLGFNNIGWDTLTSQNYFYTNDKLSIMIFKVFENENWSNLSRTIYKYDAEGNLSSLLYENWQDSSWVEDIQIRYYYSVTGKRDSIVAQTWANGVWLSKSKGIYFYNSNEIDIDSIIIKDFLFSSWENTMKREILYDEKHNQIEQLDKIWEFGKWKNSSKQIYSYNKLDLIEEVYCLEWDYDQWVNGEGVIYFQNSNSDELKGAFIAYSVTAYYSEVTDVEDDSNFDDYYLFQNYPNPFNPSTTIKYSVPVNVKGETANVKLTVYDVLGREVTTLVNTEQRAGNYEVIFDASVISSDLTSGVYFYKLQTGNFTQSKKMLLLK